MRESGAKWKKPWGRERVVIRPILAPVVNIDNVWWQNIKKIAFFFHYLHLLYWLINLFYSFKKWELRSSISQNLFLNIPYPFNFPPKYPVSLYFFTQISRIPITPNRASVIPQAKNGWDFLYCCNNLFAKCSNRQWILIFIRILSLQQLQLRLSRQLKVTKKSDWTITNKVFLYSYLGDS